MRAAGFDEFGPAEVLHTIEVEPAEPGPDEVRIANKAAGVQRFDTVIRAGRGPASKFVTTFPAIPGNEFAGVVDAIGPDVENVSVGDEVIGWRLLGSYSETLIAPAAQLSAKPAAMDWEIAGGFNAAAQTSSVAIESLKVDQGDTLLILGAAGTVGTVAAQLARYFGAMVVGTAREEHHEYLWSIGVTPVAYGPGEVDRIREMAPGGVDAALDCVGTAALPTALELVSDRARIKTIGAFGSEEANGMTPIEGERNAERLAGMIKLWEKGDLEIFLRDVYPLDQAAAAHAQVETGHGRGKSVLRLAS
jgi:NADPH:quinone reductase-like Zn-dependent oxidoreductase